MVCLYEKWDQWCKFWGMPRSLPYNWVHMIIAHAYFYIKCILFNIQKFSNEVAKLYKGYFAGPINLPRKIKIKTQISWQETQISAHLSITLLDENTPFFTCFYPYFGCLKNLQHQDPIRFISVNSLSMDRPHQPHPSNSPWLVALPISKIDTHMTITRCWIKNTMLFPKDFTIYLWDFKMYTDWDQMKLIIDLYWIVITWARSGQDPSDPYGIGLG